MAKDPKPPKPQHLPQFVGYREVQTALGVSRRTIERMVREGRFPKPSQLAPNRVGWQVETVTGWLDERGQGLVAHAVAHAEDLSPDELEDKAVDLIVKSLEQRSGKPVDPSNLTLHMTNRLGWDDFKAAEVEEFARHAERFKNFSAIRASILAAWLFAELRPMFEWSDDQLAAEIANPAKMESYGRQALHDEDWDELEEWLARREGKSN